MTTGIVPGRRETALRILCVDDDGLVLAVTADLLRDLGHDVVEAAGGQDAARTIACDNRFDMLVTDIHMPGGPSGQELARMARDTRPDMRVIYFSGLGHVIPPDTRDAVLRKPCSLGELQQAIDRTGSA